MPLESDTRIDQTVGPIYRDTAMPDESHATSVPNEPRDRTDDRIGVPQVVGVGIGFGHRALAGQSQFVGVPIQKRKIRLQPRFPFRLMSM